MSTPAPQIDARLHHTQRPGYVESLVSQAAKEVGGISRVAEHCGVGRQYLHAISVGDRVPSYATQVCLELLLDQQRGGAWVRVDAPTEFRSNPYHIALLVQHAVNVCGGNLALARRAGVSRQFLHRLIQGERRLRYPLQVVLEAIIATADQYARSDEA